MSDKYGQYKDFGLLVVLSSDVTTASTSPDELAGKKTWCMDTYGSERRTLEDRIVFLLELLCREGVLRPDKGEEGPRPGGQDCHQHHWADLPLPLRYREASHRSGRPHIAYPIFCSRKSRNISAVHVNSLRRILLLESYNSYWNACTTI